MRAFVVTGPHESHIEERPIPQIKDPKDVLVAVKYVGICGTDMHIYDGSRAFKLPIVPGHEISGEVVEAGAGVTTLKPGTPVVHRIEAPCGHCYACRHGKINCCSNLGVTGATRDGGFEEYIVAPESQWIPFEKERFSYKQAAMVEPFTIGAQAVARAELCEGDQVLIHGAGPIGLVVLATAKKHGAVCTVSEMIPERLEVAKKLGADHVLNPADPEWMNKLREYCGPEGPNVVFDAVGLPKVLGKSAEYCSNAARLVTLGFSTSPIEIPMNLITSKELSLLGSRNETFRTESVVENFDQYLDDVDNMISNVFPLEESAIAFEKACAKDPSVFKILVKVSDTDI